MFSRICISKKIAEKNTSPRLNYILIFKKSSVSFNKKVIFVFHTIFKLGFIMQIIHCFIHRCLYSLFILFCSLISVFKKQNTEKMLTVSYSCNWQKFKNKMNEKWSQEYQSMDPEYVTRQIIVFWSFFWDDFIVWFKYRLENPK